MIFHRKLYILIGSLLPLISADNLAQESQSSLKQKRTAQDVTAAASGGLLGAASSGGYGDNYFMYAHNPAPKEYEFGYRRGNDYHNRERYEKVGPEHNFKTKVRWHDEYGGYGEHYWDYNHGPKYDDYHHDDYHSDDHGGYSEPVATVVESADSKDSGIIEVLPPFTLFTPAKREARYSHHINEEEELSARPKQPQSRALEQQATSFEPQLPLSTAPKSQLLQPRDLKPQLPQPRGIKSQLSQSRNLQPQLPQPRNLQPQLPQPKHVHPQLPQPRNLKQQLLKQSAATKKPEKAFHHQQDSMEHQKKRAMQRQQQKIIEQQEVIREKERNFEWPQEFTVAEESQSVESKEKPLEIPQLVFDMATGNVIDEITGKHYNLTPL